MNDPTPLTYRAAGVDIDAGDLLVERIKPFARSTRTPHVLADVGGFAGLCKIPAGLVEPVLVSGTDGVGTKLKVAFAAARHDTIGQDLVAMCVNDVLTVGATPLFFLDYFATGALDVAVAESVIRGIADGCKIAGCALLGGETAELPGMYAAGEYDLAGFAVGVVERAKLLDGSRVKPGDSLLALPSSGLHSNGYSLARRVLLEQAGLSLATHPGELSRSLGEELLTPTRIYSRAAATLLATGTVKAFSHITGGGLPGNLPRVLPEGTGARLRWGSWPVPAVFSMIERLGPVEFPEMLRTFNMGVGLVVVVSSSEKSTSLAALRDVGEEVYEIGEIVEVPGDTEFEARVELVGGPS